MYTRELNSVAYMVATLERTKDGDAPEGAAQDEYEELLQRPSDWLVMQSLVSLIQWCSGEVSPPAGLTKTRQLQWIVQQLRSVRWNQTAERLVSIAYADDTVEFNIFDSRLWY
jgi:hypothetical protein